MSNIEPATTAMRGLKSQALKTLHGRGNSSFNETPMKGESTESTQSGSSPWAALGLILSMTACTSSTAPDIRLPGQLVVGLSTAQQQGSFDAAGQAFTKELGAHSVRVGYNHGDHNFGVNWAAENGVGVLFFLGYSQGCNPKTASGRQCYADRSAGLAQKYGNKVQYYEVWNEWNGGSVSVAIGRSPLAMMGRCTPTFSAGPIRRSRLFNRTLKSSAVPQRVRTLTLSAKCLMRVRETAWTWFPYIRMSIRRPYFLSRIIRPRRLALISLLKPLPRWITSLDKK